MHRTLRQTLPLVAISTAFLSTACAASDHGKNSTPRRIDARLLGQWHATRIVQTGRAPLRADDATDAGLDFTDTGRMVANGNACGAPFVTTDGRHLDLRHDEGTGTCEISGFDSVVGARIAGVLERLEGRHHIVYSIQDETLTLTTGEDRITLLKGPAPTHPAPSTLLRSPSGPPPPYPPSATAPSPR